jgi:hypothetical protein
MRFTIAQVLKLIIYAAVAIALAASFVRDLPGFLTFWIFSIPFYGMAVGLAWAVLSVLLYRGIPRRYWASFWLLVAAVCALFLVGTGVAIGCFLAATKGEWSELRSVLTNIGPIFLLAGLLAYAAWFLFRTSRRESGLSFGRRKRTSSRDSQTPSA